MKINSVAIVGLGAVGAVVGEQLKSVLGKNLFCVVDEKRKTRYQKDGIFINGIRQDFNYVTPSELKPVDLVIIGTKNLQLQEALDEIENGVGPDTMILSLLNGIQSETDITTRYGEARTLYGFIIDLQSINLSGKIDCMGRGKIVFGENDNSKSERILAVKALFDEAGQKNEIPEDIHLQIWKKFFINTIFNSLGAITRSTYGGFKFEEMKSMARKIGYEVVKVANAEGIEAITNELVDEDINLTLSYNPLGKCSMLQDTEAERRTENDFFCGTVCRLGKKHNIETPYCQFLYELLKSTEEVRTIR